MDETRGGWKRTLGTIWAAQAACIAGFSFATPFIPYYVKELGVKDPAALSIWAGLLRAAPAMTMIMFAPLWGVIADRYGKKLMAERAMFGSAVLLAAMSLARSPEQLLILRLLQGAISGTMTASLTLAASVTPGYRAGVGLGLVQMASYTGMAVGPVLGGYVSQVVGAHASMLVGYRMCFVISGVLLGLGGVLVTFFVRDEGRAPSAATAPRRAGAPEPTEPAEPEDRPPGLVSVLSTGGFGAILAIMFLSQLSRTALAPIFPLYVEDVFGEANRNLICGAMLGVSAAAAALASVGAGWLGDRFGHKRILGMVMLLGGLCAAPHALVVTLFPLALLRLGTGAQMGGTTSSLNALVHRLIPRGSYGRGYGLIQSATSMGLMAGPLVGGLLGAWLGFRLPFAVMGLLQVLIGLYVLVRPPTVFQAPSGGARLERIYTARK